MPIDKVRLMGRHCRCTTYKVCYCLSGNTKKHSSIVTSAVDVWLSFVIVPITTGVALLVLEVRYCEGFFCGSQCDDRDGASPPADGILSTV